MSKQKVIVFSLIIVVLAGLTVVLRGGVSQISIGRGFSSSKLTKTTELAMPNSMGAEVADLGYVSPGMPSKTYYPEPIFPNNGDSLAVEDRKYEVYGSFSLVTSDVSGYFRKVRDYILSVDGKVLNLQTGTSGRYQTGYMTAKVPVDKFDESTQKIVEGVKSVESQQVSSTDVTGQVEATKSQLSDLQDQRSLKEVELLQAKTELEKRRVELEIKRIDQQIVQVQSQQAAQGERVEYATLSISASSSKMVYNPSGRPDLRDELDRAYNSVMDNLYVIAQFMIWVVVYSLVLVPAMLLIGFLRKKSSIKNTTAKLE